MNLSFDVQISIGELSAITGFSYDEIQRRARMVLAEMYAPPGVVPDRRPSRIKFIRENGEALYEQYAKHRAYEQVRDHGTTEDIHYDESLAYSIAYHVDKANDRRNHKHYNAVFEKCAAYRHALYDVLPAVKAHCDAAPVRKRPSRRT
ncbi:hypothetical protein [Paraburkholderia oxyphila]|uniref:hypothetical protein n=1 Tax=Paraburkholderia oxyphila TaxID=614212 RepID=UPI00048079B2|nr:hypothetical protein [Paraburkholderia oxyphila]